MSVTTSQRSHMVGVWCKRCYSWNIKQSKKKRGKIWATKHVLRVLMLIYIYNYFEFLMRNHFISPIYLSLSTYHPFDMDIDDGFSTPFFLPLTNTLENILRESQHARVARDKTTRKQLISNCLLGAPVPPNRLHSASIIPNQKCEWRLNKIL